MTLFARKVGEVGMNDIQTLANIAGMTAELIDNGILVRVVRCKDCKYFDSYNVKCKRNHDPEPPYNEWFCADGERK